MTEPPGRDELVGRLAAAGCVAAEEEADELLQAAGGLGDALEAMVARRVGGEPLAWVTGSTVFAGTIVRVHPGVYVPRWQTEPLARRAAELLNDEGIAVDLCTGSGAIAAVLSARHPNARVLGSDLDPLACRCAIDNGVDVRQGDLADALPSEIAGRVDVVTAVPPYVPTGEIAYLPRDVREREPRRALDGGPDGTVVLERVIAAAGLLLRAGGTLLVELGADQDRLVSRTLGAAGFEVPSAIVDDEGDLRGLEARRGPVAAT